MRHRRSSASSSGPGNDTSSTTAIGRTSLTQRHATSSRPVQRAAEHARLDAAWGIAPVQLARDSHSGLDDAGVQSAAAHGLSAPGGSLPHLDAIQRSFGEHDVSGVTAHVGGAARDASDQLGAHAYATGDHVAFAEQPSLFLAAHEAAHVVQQRGGVQLSSAVGQAGDGYEQQADAVAARVVAGESAADLLGRASASASSSAVQCKPKDKKPKITVNPTVISENDPDIEEADLETARLNAKAVLFEWQESQIAMIEGVRNWTNRNWKEYFLKTGGKGGVPTNEGLLTTFFGGVWGNFYTDAPDTVLGAIGHGVADAAKDAAGAVVGLIVSSAVATMVEMCVGAFLKAVTNRADESVAAFTSGVEHGVEITSAVNELNIKKSDDEARAVRKEKQACDNAVEGMSLEQLEAMRGGLEQAIEDAAMKASMASDSSLCEEHLRKWVLLHASGMGTSTGSVDPEKYSAAMKEVGGTKWLKEQTATGQTVPNPRTGPSEIHEFQSHQARIMLEGAGLQAEDIAKHLAALKPTPMSWAVRVTDREAFERFVTANWGVALDPATADKDGASVEVVLQNSSLGTTTAVQVLTEMIIEVFPGGREIKTVSQGRFGSAGPKGGPRSFKP